MRAEVAGYLDRLAGAKAAMLSRPPVAPGRAEAEDRPVVASNVVGAPEKDTGGRCKAARRHPRAAKHVDHRWFGAKSAMLNGQPVALGRAEAEGRPIVVSKVAGLPEEGNANRVGSPKAEATGDPCRVAR